MAFGNIRLAVQAFGGPWTKKKLEVFRKYLCAWLAIFHKNPRASHFEKAYLDGFAGSGSVWIIGRESEMQSGSAAIALSVDPGFDKYILIDKVFSNIHQLNKLCSSNPALKEKVDLRHGDCNKTITDWTAKTNWRATRALVLLDPFALEVRWSTIEALARTKAVDLWILFPLMAVNRLLKRKELPPESHENILDRLFGVKSWRTEFYRVAEQQSLFEDSPIMQKRVNPLAVSQFFINRLATVFPGVLRQPLVLKNRTGSPIFCLMFAAANPRTAGTAVKIARDIVAKAIEEE